MDRIQQLALGQLDVSLDHRLVDRRLATFATSFATFQTGLTTARTAPTFARWVISTRGLIGLDRVLHNLANMGKQLIKQRLRRRGPR